MEMGKNKRLFNLIELILCGEHFYLQVLVLFFSPLIRRKNNKQTEAHGNIIDENVILKVRVE